MSLYKKIINKLKINILDDDERKRGQLFYLEVILCFISTIMSILNIISSKYPLLVATGLMAIFSFANAIVVYKIKDNITVGTVIFTIKMFILFNYFIIFGGTEGFSTIWMLLTPSCAPFAFGKKKGSVMSLVLLLELVFFFYTPIGNSIVQCSHYTNSFLIRFPVLYTSFFFIGFYLESVRERTHNELTTLQKKVEYQSKHDQLTGLNNRFGFKAEIDKYVVGNQAKFGLMIIDIDHFKEANDNFGHIIGDRVLKIVADRIQNLDGSSNVCCRWGGEEFAVFLKGSECKDLKTLAEEIRIEISKPMEIDGNVINVTASIGGACSLEVANNENKDIYVSLIELADNRMYHAKKMGRNKSICKD